MIQHLPKKTLNKLSRELTNEIRRRKLLNKINPPKDADFKTKLSARQNKWLSDPKNREKQNARRRAKYHADKLKLK
jgi:hypothetical protein